MKKVYLSLVFILSVWNEDNGTPVLVVNNTFNARVITEWKRRKWIPEKDHIFWVTFDSWGRASKKCKGFGVCEWKSCAFCCTEAGEIVNCDDKTKLNNVGEVIINAETKTGYLTIKLDSSIRIEATAINEKLICYMDKDIISGNYTLHKGDYEFDKSIGRFGGYKLNITEK